MAVALPFLARFCLGWEAADTSVAFRARFGAISVKRIAADLGLPEAARTIFERQEPCGKDAEACDLRKNGIPAPG